MTQAQLIAAMLEAARPIVKAFHGDLSHDARTIADAAEGDVFAWGPLECGSRLICLWRGDRPNMHAKLLAEAMRQAGAPDQWYRIVISASACGFDAVKRNRDLRRGGIGDRDLKEPPRP